MTSCIGKQGPESACRNDTSYQLSTYHHGVLMLHASSMAVLAHVKVLAHSTPQSCAWLDLNMAEVARAAEGWRLWVM